MKIKDIPWYDRPGIRLTREGVGSLSNADLLAILLGKGNKESVLELSNRLLKKYNLHKLEDLSIEELTNECKGDKLPALKILSFIELIKRYNKLTKGGFNYKPITSAKDVYNMFKDEFSNDKKENLSIISLDSKSNPIHIKKKVSIGTLDSSLAHPREIFREAIKANAHSIILVHNHPSGNPKPSSIDFKMTKVMQEAGKTIGIKVLDHVIIGKKGYWSFIENQSDL